MVLPDFESRILPLSEVWPGMQVKTVKNLQTPLVETVMMQNYRMTEEGPLLSGFFTLQPGEVVPAPKARRLDLPLCTKFEPIEVFTADSLPEGPLFAAFANGKSLRYRGDFGHHVAVRVNGQGLQFLDYKWDEASGDPRIVRSNPRTPENPHPEAEFVYKPPEGAFFVPIHRIQMP